MEQIRLDHQLPVKKTDHTSKGDQLKWKIGNIWYKSDYMGYEGLSETLVSHLLQKSTLSHPFVLYQPVRIAYRGTLRSGCSSPDFLKANQMLIPLEKLYRQNTGDSLAISLAAFSEPAERIEAKPFSSDFDTQLDAAEELYGIQLHFSFTTKDVCTELASLADYYPLEIRQRVEQIIRRQMRKYGYLIRS